MGLLAGRAATRMGTRQQYRTMSRMQRRRSFFQSGTGMHQDFQPREEETGQAPNQSTEQAAPDYTSELKKLASLKDQGLITDEEFSAKKKQLLGI